MACFRRGERILSVSYLRVLAQAPLITQPLRPPITRKTHYFVKTKLHQNICRVLEKDAGNIPPEDCLVLTW